MNKKLLKAVIISEIFIGGVALLFIIVALWNMPLGPSIGNALAAVQTGENSLAASSPDALAGEPVAEPTSSPQSIVSRVASLLKPSKASSGGLCDGPVAMNFLLIGSDARTTGYHYGLADAIRIVHIDFTTPKVMMVDIPRDLWVSIPGIADHYGITHAKINQAYFFGSPGMGYYDGQGEGPGLLAQTLYENFGVQVDHYLAMDLTTFPRVIDALGGIDVNIASEIDTNAGHDGANPEYVLEPGSQHLDGALALRLARDRYPTIYERARNQNIVLRGIEAKLLSPAVIPEIPTIISEFANSVQTDLSASDISKLVCIGQKLSSDNTSFVAFPDNMFTGGYTFDPYRNVNTYTLSADFNTMRTYMTDFNNGTWPGN